MDTLISLKGSYNDFKDAFYTQLKSAKGELRDSLQYGAFYGIPIEKKKIVIFFDGVDKEKTFRQMNQLIKYCRSSDEFKDYILKVVVGRNIQREKVSIGKDAILEEKQEEAKREFASAEFIIAGDGLPKYFIKKRGQKVIRLLPEVNSNRSRIENAQYHLSWFLNSSVIIVSSNYDKNILEKKYNLLNIYTGEIKVIEDIEEEREKQILKYISDTKLIKENYSKFNIKKHILIFSTWGLETGEQEYIKLITDALDYHKYDVTLVMKRPEDGKAEELLEELNENVRFIYRRGTFPSSPEEYTDIQYLLKNLASFEDVGKAYTFFDKDVIERECNRLWGNIVFDDFISVGKHSAIWTAMAGSIKAKKKFRLDSSNWIEEEQECSTISKQRAFENKVKVYEEVYSGILVSSQKMQDLITERGYFDSKKLVVFNFPSIMAIPNKSLACEYIDYHGSQYLILQKKKFIYGGMLINLLPVPRNGEKAYIANGQLCDGEKLMKIFSEIHQVDSKTMLVVYGAKGEKIRDIGKKYNLENRISVIEDQSLENSLGMSDYLRLFEGYLATDDVWNYCPIRTCMELLNKKIIVSVNNRMIQKIEKKFKDSQQYKEYLNKCWDELLD